MGPSPFRAGRGGFWELTVKVVPGASQNKVVGLENGELKIKIKAPPLEGEANRELIGFIAALLKCPRSTVELARGSRSRHKVIRLRSVEPIQALKILVQPKPGGKDGGTI